MGNRTIVITGASDGIGAVAARRLSSDGNTVVVVGRSEEKTRAVASKLGADYLLTDFADLTEVRRLADELLSRYPQIDVLANNAGGVMSKARELTKNGHERTFQVNHLAPFLLTTLLMDRLIESRAAVLNTASEANYRFGDIDINDLDGRKKYTPFKAYCNSKLANILFTKELHRRYHRGGLATVAFHPGNVASNFAADSGSFLRFVYTTPLKRLLLIDTEKGSDELVWLASTTPDTDWQSGGYYDRHKPAEPMPKVRIHTWHANCGNAAKQWFGPASDPTWLTTMVGLRYKRYSRRDDSNT